MVVLLPFTSQAQVLNRGCAPIAFLDELVAWARNADDSIFAQNNRFDIYSKVEDELGPFTSPTHRKAVMCEVLRVLAGFESSWNWQEGIDTSKLGALTPDNAEAGAWQVSYDSRSIAPELRFLLMSNKIADGVIFQRATKFDHHFAMSYIAQLLRYTTKANGPLYKGDERAAIRLSLRDEENSIYPWLQREAVAEFAQLLS